MAIKPGFVSYATMTRSLKGSSFLGKDDVSDDRTYSYVFERDGTPVRAMWSLERTDVTLHTDEPLTLRTMMGERATYKPHDGEVYFTIGKNPIYVSGAVDAVERGAPVSFDANVPARDVPIPAAFGADASQLDAERVTFEVAGHVERLDVSGSGRASTKTHIDAHYRPSDPSVAGTVWIDDTPAGRLVSGTEGGSVAAYFREKPVFDGLSAVSYQFGDETMKGPTVYDVETHAGEQCWSVPQPEGGDYRRYIGLNIEDTYAYDVEEPIHVSVRYWDSDTGHFTLQYDAHGGTDWNTRFTRHERSVAFEGSGQWKEATFTIKNGKLANRQNFRTDFRIDPVVDGSRSDGPLCISRVTVERPSESGALPAPTAGGAMKGPNGELVDAPSPTDNEAGGGDSSGRSNDGSSADTGTPTTGAGSPGLGVLAAVVTLLVSALVSRRRE
jgi:hypothetical protein